MDKEKMKELVTYYAKVRAALPPFPEQSDEEKQLAQEGLLQLIEEMKPLRQNANSLIL